MRICVDAAVKNLQDPVFTTRKAKKMRMGIWRRNSPAVICITYVPFLTIIK